MRGTTAKKGSHKQTRLVGGSEVAPELLTLLCPLRRCNPISPAVGVARARPRGTIPGESRIEFGAGRRAPGRAHIAFVGPQDATCHLLRFGSGRARRRGATRRGRRPRQTDWHVKDSMVVLCIAQLQTETDVI